MRKLEEIKTEKEGIIVRKLLDAGLALTKDECFYIARLCGAQIIAAMAEVAVAVPRDAQLDARLWDFDGRAIHGYHIVDGVRRLITQTYTLDGVIYWTDGKREVENDGK